MIEKINLWSSDNRVDWRAALKKYPGVIRAQGVNRLGELDAWYRDELPALITKRKPNHITRDELIEVVIWKMKRGVWRARNRALVAENDALAVKLTSIQAFAAVPDLRTPIIILSQLAGVGPATASAVLAAYRPDAYPFFDELVAAQIPHLGPVAFTAAYYQRYASALRERAEQLNTNARGRKFTAHDVSQALWANVGGKVRT